MNTPMTSPRIPPFSISNLESRVNVKKPGSALALSFQDMLSISDDAVLEPNRAIDAA